MKRVLLLGFVCLMLTAPLHATEIFWDQSPPADPIVTDSDFKGKYQAPIRAKSLEQMDVYDSGEVLQLDYEKAEEIARSSASAERESDTVVVPRSTEPLPTVAPARPERTKRNIEPAATRVRERPRPRDVEPTMVAPEPLSQPAPKSEPPEVETRRPTPVPAVADETPQPEPKKPAWGQEESKTSNDQQKFRWGQPK